MQNKLVKAATLLLLAATAAAQEAPTASGGDASGTGGSVAYSVGQVAYINNAGTSGKESQGVQQPYEMMTTSVSDPGYYISLAAFPNPASDQLTLQIGESKKGKLSYSLFDAQGKLIEAKAVATLQTQIDMGACAAGTYILSVISEAKPIQTFKIVKK